MKEEETYLPSALQKLGKEKKKKGRICLYETQKYIIDWEIIES